MDTRILHLQFLLIFLLMVLVKEQAPVAGRPFPPKTTVEPVKVSLTEAAAQGGAVCLDGSPPTYYYHKGYGTGADNWLLHIQGGGWCYNIASCFERALTTLGSTIDDGPASSFQSTFTGLLSQSATENPDFYNWNLVWVRYCDGASFSGDVQEPLQNLRGGLSKIYFRGQRIWKAVITDLLEKRGMNKSQNAVLSGCSAGGLTTIIHCDQFQELMPQSTIVKCLSDAGFFLDQKNVEGVNSFREQYKSVVAMQNTGPSLHPGCTSSRNSSEVWECFFPQYFIQYVKTPIYILNSAYDSWQIPNVLIPSEDWKPSNGTWRACYSNFSLCTVDQFAKFLGFRNSMVSILRKVMSHHLEQSAVFIVSCQVHCMGSQSWNGRSPGSIKINNVTPAEAFGDWYFERQGSDRLRIAARVPTDSSCSG